MTIAYRQTRSKHPSVGGLPLTRLADGVHMEPRMILNKDQLGNELKIICKGRGVLELDIKKRLGPQAQALCGIEQEEDAATVREKVSAAVKDLCDGLPDDLRLSVLAA